MAYCDKCGNNNPEDAEYCSKCGISMNDDNDRDRYGEDRDRYRGDRRRYREDRYRYRNECFGLPHGGLIVGILIGLFLILLGLSSIYGFSLFQYIWPIIIIIVGLLIILSAIYRYTQRNRES